MNFDDLIRKANDLIERRTGLVFVCSVDGPIEHLEVEQKKLLVFTEKGITKIELPDRFNPYDEWTEQGRDD